MAPLDQRLLLLLEERVGDEAGHLEQMVGVVAADGGASSTPDVRSWIQSMQSNMAVLLALRSNCSSCLEPFEIHRVLQIASVKMRRVRWAFLLSAPASALWLVLLA